MSPETTSLAPAADEAGVYARLVQGFKASTGEAREDRWRWLMAAHIVGQVNLKQHAHSHCLMLGFALQTRDWNEAAGQLFRLVLVPFGHAIGRLPAGNIGRATVSAFRPMALDPEMRLLIAKARASQKTAIRNVELLG